MSLTTGTRDLRMIEQVITHPQWEMPAGLYKGLPASMAEIVFKQVEDPKTPGKKVYAYSARKRSIAARILTHMHQQNINAAPPVQEHDVHVSGDLHTTLEQMDQANLSDEQLEKLAAAAPVLDRLKAMQSNDDN
ncbi:hypothetical protein [Gimesia fumaroli]|uniref:Uncharacterized protein n=1 Tax=Gimesia fumaroli TaxID=2527976 RepID=A0A518I8V2_9PLAN|nr:hypothetical protein [Gimesia fumaroli]QDV49548.1 hypothetical protein Enr17x_15680 [Gimesia fumaroli]